MEDATWVDRFPELSPLDQCTRTTLVQGSQIISVPADTIVFAPGKAAESFILLLDGTVKVHQTSKSGRDIILYRVSGGETCIMTTSCLLSDELYNAEGIAETEVTAVAVPKTVFEDVLASSPEFRRFVFSTYSQRIADVIHIVEEVAFERMDKRLSQRLIDLSGPDDVLEMTHQSLATELGTAREVVGRQLKEMERRGCIELARGVIKIRDRNYLASIARADE